MEKDQHLDILVIDDEQEFCGMVIHMLESAFPGARTVGLSNGKEGLRVMKDEVFDCILLDYRMPEMDGMEVLQEVRAAGIDIPVVIMTGFGDEHVAVEVMKAGASDYLPKADWNLDTLSRTVRNVIALSESENKRKMAEAELLENTLIGAINVIVDILGLVNPAALARAARIKRYVHCMTTHLRLSDAWQYELAAILSQIGYILVPSDLLLKYQKGVSLSETEQNILQSPPNIASTLIAKIPRLESIAQIIADQRKPYHGHTAADMIRAGDYAALGGHMLNIAVEFDRLAEQGLGVRSILEQLREKHVTYDTVLIEALEGLEVELSSDKTRSIGVKELKIGMQLSGDVYSRDGVLLASRGQEVTLPLLRRLLIYAEGIGVRQPIQISTSSKS